MAEYEGRLTLFHQDLYRLGGTEEALAGGLLDERQDEGVTLSEWADRLDAGLDPQRLTVAIDPSGEGRRDIELRGHGEIARRYIEAARRWLEERAAA
jgi:tRNA threonylcarbamoyladenosine biosynthesis protein TsaE